MSAKFRREMARVGLSLRDRFNLCYVCTDKDRRYHQGPHPKAYHEEVYRLLTLYTQTRMPNHLAKAQVQELLARLCIQLQTPGNDLRRLITTNLQ